MSDFEDSDDEYAPIVASAWGDQGDKQQKETGAASWGDLVDPNFKVGPGGLGGGNLHRRGVNYKPVDEQFILNQRLKIPNPTKKKKEKAASRGMGTRKPPSTRPTYLRQEARPFIPPTRVPPFATRAPPPTARPPPSTTRPPPPGSNAWTSGALVDVPFWEQQEKQTNGNQPNGGWNNNNQRPDVPSNWDEPQRQPQNVRQQPNDRQPFNGHPQPNDRQPFHGRPQPSERPPFNGRQQPNERQPFNGRQQPNERQWNDKPDAPSSWVNEQKDVPPRPTGVMRPPPGLFKNAISRIGNDNISQPPPGLSAVPMHQRQQSSGYQQPGARQPNHTQQQQQQQQQQGGNQPQPQPGHARSGFQQQQPSYQPQPQYQQSQPSHQQQAYQNYQEPSTPAPTPPKLRANEDKKDNPLVITINMELESHTIPVRLRLHDDPYQKATEFSYENGITDANIIKSLRDIFSTQHRQAIQKRNVNNRKH